MPMNVVKRRKTRRVTTTTMSTPPQMGVQLTVMLNSDKAFQRKQTMDDDRMIL